MRSYQLYVDDSGTREYDAAKDYVNSGKSRYFVYGALLIEQREASLLATRLRELKLLSFKTTNVEVKSNWLRIPVERERRYLKPFGISDIQLDAFVEAYYRLIVLAPLELIAAVVDKPQVQEAYAEPWYAPTLAYEILLQRAVQAVPTGAKLAVTVDDITGKTPKRNDYKTLLAKHHQGLMQTGSKLMKSLSFACLSGPVKFMHSHHSDLVQVADLAAYNVMRQFRDHGTQWEQPAVGQPLPMYPYFKKIAGKFRHDADGRVQGFGIVKFPKRAGPRWTLKKSSKPNVAAP
jgi:hypothetical protein